MNAETEAPAAPPAATPAATPAASSKELEEAMNHLMQGKRHLLVKDYTSAVTSLAEACCLIAGKYGDLAPECGDPYFFYGKALLELARAEAGVIEMTSPKSSSDEEEAEADGDEDDKDEEKEETEEEEAKEDSEEGEKVEKNGEESEKNGEESEKNGEESEKNGEESEEKKSEEAEKNGDEKAENGAGTSKGDDGEEICDGEDNGDDGEVNNLQLAWEVLEMAKLIYQKQADAGTNSQEAKTRLTEVLLKLGEVGIESENWPIAIEDLRACLTMQKEILTEDDRKLAETYYHLAVAHSNNNEYQESIESFEKACNQLQLRIDSLEAKRPKADAIEKTVIDSEIKELKEVLVEMKEKLNDIITEKDEPAPKDDADDIIKNGSSKPASNIAHLVRKKPKAESPEKKTDAESSSKSETTAENADKTDAEGKVEEKKRKSEEGDAVDAAAAQKKPKLETES